MFFGDSFVAGVGDPTGLGWVTRVVSAAFSAGLPLTAYNLGVRRDTSVAVAKRWRQEAEPRLFPGAAHRLIISFGTNDTVVEQGQRRVEACRSKDALEAILEGAASVDLPTLVVGPPPVADERHNERLVDLSALFAEVCETHGTPFFEVLTALRASMTWRSEVEAGDGAHPAQSSYESLAGLVLDAGWVDWLRSTPKQSRGHVAQGVSKRDDAPESHIGAPSDRLGGGAEARPDPSDGLVNP